MPSCLPVRQLLGRQAAAARCRGEHHHGGAPSRESPRAIGGQPASGARAPRKLRRLAAGDSPPLASRARDRGGFEVHPLEHLVSQIITGGVRRPGFTGDSQIRAGSDTRRARVLAPVDFDHSRKTNDLRLLFRPRKGRRSSPARYLGCGGLGGGCGKPRRRAIRLPRTRRVTQASGGAAGWPSSVPCHYQAGRHQRNLTGNINALIERAGLRIVAQRESEDQAAGGDVQRGAQGASVLRRTGGVHDVGTHRGAGAGGRERRQAYREMIGATNPAQVATAPSARCSPRTAGGTPFTVRTAPKTQFALNFRPENHG